MSEQLVCKFVPQIMSGSIVVSVSEVLEPIPPPSVLYIKGFLVKPECKNFIIQVMAEELFRNVLLAMAVVFVVTLVIIASPMTSFLVFLCVVFTVVSVNSHHI